MIEFFISNWYALVAILVAVALGGFAAYTFVKLPTTSQIEALREWLKYAVTMAEKELGSGTGQLKLRLVYDMFLQKFSWLASFIAFEKFSSYVDEALEWLNNQLTSNKAVSALIESEE